MAVHYTRQEYHRRLDSHQRCVVQSGYPCGTCFTLSEDPGFKEIGKHTLVMLLAMTFDKLALRKNYSVFLAISTILYF